MHQTLRVVVFGKIGTRSAGAGGNDVAEGAKPLGRLLVHFSRARLRACGGRFATGDLFEGVEKLPARRRQSAVQVLALAPIGVEVVELGNRQIDVLEPIPVEPGEGRPVSIEVEGERFEIAVSIAGRDGIEDRRDEGLALLVGLWRQADELHQRGRHVDEAHSSSHPDPFGQDAFPAHDERHVHRRVVGEHPVRLLAVLAEALAVVRREDDERILHRTVLAERRDEPAQGVVGVGHLSGIVVPRVPVAKCGWGGVRGVGIVQMNESEPSRSLRFPDPGKRRCEDVVGASLRDREIVERARVAVEIVVELEPLVDSKARVERKRSQEGRGAIAHALESFRDGGLSIREPIGSVIPDLVRERVPSGKDRCVGRQGDGHVRNGALEHDPAFPQRVGERSFHLSPVRSEMIRPKGVHADQQNVRRGIGGKARCGRLGVQPKPRARGKRQRRRSEEQHFPAAPQWLHAISLLSRSCAPPLFRRHGLMITTKAPPSRLG